MCFERGASLPSARAFRLSRLMVAVVMGIGVCAVLIGPMISFWNLLQHALFVLLALSSLQQFQSGDSLVLLENIANLVVFAILNGMFCAMSVATLLHDPERLAQFEASSTKKHKSAQIKAALWYEDPGIVISLLCTLFYVVLVLLSVLLYRDLKSTRLHDFDPESVSFQAGPQLTGTSRYGATMRGSTGYPSRLSTLPTGSYVRTEALPATPDTPPRFPGQGFKLGKA